MLPAYGLHNDPKMSYRQDNIIISHTSILELLMYDAKVDKQGKAREWRRKKGRTKVQDGWIAPNPLAVFKILLDVFNGCCVVLELN